MNVFVHHSEGGYAPQFIELCQHLKCENYITTEQLLQYGFVKHSDVLIYRKYIDDNAIFSIGVTKEKHDNRDYRYTSIAVTSKLTPEEIVEKICS
jgi:hypothetical protein